MRVRSVIGWPYKSVARTVVSVCRSVASVITRHDCVEIRTHFTKFCAWVWLYRSMTVAGDVFICRVEPVSGHFGPKTFRHHVFGAEVSQIFALVPKCPLDTSALECMRHFGPRTKKCLECRHCLKKCRPTLCLLL